MKEAQPILEEIEGRNKLGIIVGGTNYYTETLLLGEKQK